MQGLINGFSRGDPSKLVQGRDGDGAYARALALLATVATRFHGDASTLPDGLVDTFPDISGSGNSATAAGALRPTAASGELVFAGTHRMVTSSFSIGARSSGAIAVRYTGTSQGSFQYGLLNQHTSALAQNTGSDRSRVRAMGGGSDAGPVISAYPWSGVLAWSFDTSGGTALVDGVSFSISANAVAAQTLALTIGDLTGGTFPLSGAIRGMVIVDATLSAADLLILSNGFRAKYPV